MNAAGYMRASTDEQVNEGHSLDAQEHAIVEFCRARGWTLIEIYVDPGLSGASQSRPALQRLLRQAAEGRFDVVVVHAIDRFYRDLQGLLTAFKHLQDHGVSFLSLTENLDFTTPWGKLTLAVMGTLAEIYLDRLSAETSKGKRARARKGLPNGMPPLGYCRGNCASCTDPNGEGYCPRYGQPSLSPAGPADPWILHPIEQAAVQMAFTLYATGNYSDGQVANMLNAHQHTDENGRQIRFRTKGRRGRCGPGRFSKDSIRDMLQNFAYTGQMPYFGDKLNGRRKRDPVAVYPGPHPALVDQALFDRCQEVRTLMSCHPRKAENHMSNLYLLSGLLYCQQCKRPMRAQSGNGVRYYQDKTRIQHSGPCDQVMVRAEEVEEQVAQYFLSFHLPATWREEVIARLCSAEDLEAMERSRQEVESRLARIVELYLAGDLRREQYEQEKRACYDQLADLQPNGYSVVMNAGETLNRFETLWSTGTALEKKKLLRSAVAAVLIRGKLVRAIQLREAFYPFVPYRLGRNHGSDGIRTRDLRLDRPTCLPLHYAPRYAAHYTTALPGRQILGRPLLEWLAPDEKLDPLSACRP
jgi:site-specific DNA recombinase